MIGRCTKCSTFDEFLAEIGTVLCCYCSCAPGCHELLQTSTAATALSSVDQAEEVSHPHESVEPVILESQFQEGGFDELIKVLIWIGSANSLDIVINNWRIKQIFYMTLATVTLCFSTFESI